MIELSNIDKSFQNGKSRAFVLQGINLSIKEGESVAIMGRSGSGKTTLLHILAGLIPFDSGSYRFGDMEIAQADENTRCRMRFEQIGYVMQNNALLYDRNVKDNIALPLQFDVRYDDEQENLVRNVARMVGIQDKLAQRPQTLSGGEQQRVAIARALVVGAPLILADEPTGSLDADTEKDILGIFIRLNQAGKTLVLITHDQSVAEICKKHYLLRDGRLILQ